MTSQNKQETTQSKIDRREVLKQSGKYAAFTAAAMITLLAPQKAMADSTVPVDASGTATTEGGLE